MLPPVVTGVIGLGLWFLLKRPLEQWTARTEHLETEVAQLRDTRIARIETDVGRHADEITRVKTHFVHKAECAEKHRQTREQMAGFTESVLKLERVGEKCDQALKRTETLMEQQIGLQSDIARLAGKME